MKKNVRFDKFTLFVTYLQLSMTSTYSTYNISWHTLLMSIGTGTAVGTGTYSISY